MKEPLNAPHFYIFMSTKKNIYIYIYVKGRLKTQPGGLRKKRVKERM